MDKLFLFRSHYSPHGRGIIQVNDYDPKTPSQVPNLADLALKAGLKQVFLVDSSMAGIHPAYKTLDKVGISLVFGLLVHFVSDATDKGENANVGAHKNIIFIKNENGYKDLIKISTKAHVDFFHEIPRLDYNYFHNIYNPDNIALAVPFYNSFLARNVMAEGQCVPDFRKIKPTFFLEENELPFDGPLRRLVARYAENEGCETVEAQTVLYESPKQALAYQVRRLMNRSQGKANTIVKPNLDHWGSDTFCLCRE